MKDTVNDFVALIAKRLSIRQWVWADRMYRKCNDAVSNGEDLFALESEANMYLCLWLSLLYSVIEDSSLEEYSEIRADIDEIHDPLRMLRNSVFHKGSPFPQDIFYEGLIEKIIETQRKIGDAIGFDDIEEEWWSSSSARAPLG